MSTVQAMREDIERLEQVANEAEGLGETSFAMRAAARGLRQMGAQIQRDIEVALRPQLDVTIEGVPVKGHEIRVSALSRLLHSLQESVSSVAQALTGEATARASLPALIRDSTALSLAAVFPGSFGATLRGPVDKEAEAMTAIGQDPLWDPQEHRTLLDQAVDTVLDIVALAAADEADDEPIIEAVLPLGARAFKHLKDLSDAIVDNELSANIAWTHLGEPQRQVQVSKRTAQRLNDVLTANKVTERPRQLRGYMGTASEFHGGRIEIQTDDGKVIPAKVAEDLVAELASYYTRRVQAETIETTARSTATGTEKYSYLVVGLSTLPDEEPTLPGSGE